MLTIRTDLAAEAHALWREKAKETTEISGVRAREGALHGYGVHCVEILDRAGERALGLSGADVQLRGMRLQARERVLPEELECAPLLTALWQNGRLRQEELQVTF